MGCETCKAMFHNFVHVEIEVDKLPNILVCSRKAIHRKLISKHLFLCNNDSCERHDHRKEIKNSKNTLFRFF